MVTHPRYRLDGPLFFAFLCFKIKKVSQLENQQTDIALKHKFDDKFEESRNREKTKGFIEIKGTSNYWDGKTMPDTMTTTEVPMTDGLPGTFKDPTPALGASSEGSATKHLRVEWDCCSDKPTCKAKKKELKPEYKP